MRCATPIFEGELSRESHYIPLCVFAQICMAELMGRHGQAIWCTGQCLVAQGCYTLILKSIRYIV